MVVLRADPWSPDHGMGFEATVEESEVPSSDPMVETGDWEAPRRAAPEPGPVWFVDGVRRVELRVLADHGDRRVPGLFGSFAVGAVRCEGDAGFVEDRVGRALVLGGGVPHDRVEVRCGGALLAFDPAEEPRTDPNGPLERLQDLMRRAEEALAARLVLGGATLVLADGPLQLREASASPVVGVVKRSIRPYLDPDRERLLGRLGPGERTPVFGLVDATGRAVGYSWYARVAALPVPWHDRAGLARCEVRAAVGLDRAVELADRVTALLPRYAGRPGDPRTPQNLAPVAGLEAWLRHRMGDRAMVRRALVAWLARGGRDG